MDLLGPKSVIDVGCAAGTWLSVFRRSGVVDVLGTDTGYAENKMMAIAPEAFRKIDLEKPFLLERTFEMAMSLEVAEHLPEESAEGFVDSLTCLAPVILFSAANPVSEREQSPQRAMARVLGQAFRGPRVCTHRLFAKGTLAQSGSRLVVRPEFDLVCQARLS
jgi:2-polyprenyl-3-methyl-5-hydroxy-6-metoxy-1,4-benzoquinol methylase